MTASRPGLAPTGLLIDLSSWAQDDDPAGLLQRTLRPVFEAAWTARTSASPAAWTPTRPSTGQCAVTALVVQELLGGDLVRVLVAGASHYFNALPGGMEIDLTRDQFEHYEPEQRSLRSRTSVLCHPDTLQRYALLTGRLRGWPGTQLL